MSLRPGWCHRNLLPCRHDFGTKLWRCHWERPSETKDQHQPWEESGRVLGWTWYRRSGGNEGIVSGGGNLKRRDDGSPTDSKDPSRDPTTNMFRFPSEDRTPTKRPCPGLGKDFGPPPTTPNDTSVLTTSRVFHRKTESSSTNPPPDKGTGEEEVYGTAPPLRKVTAGARSEVLFDSRPPRDSTVVPEVPRVSPRPTPQPPHPGPTPNFRSESKVEICPPHFSV